MHISDIWARLAKGFRKDALLLGVAALLPVLAALLGEWGSVAAERWP